MSGRRRDERLALVLAVVPWLAQEGGSTIDEISAQFGLPADEVLAVLSVVQCCELPPYGGETLGIMVDDDGTVYVDPVVAFDRPLDFTADEAFGLLAAGRTALAVPGVEGDGPLGRAIDKLEDLLGAGLVVDVGAPEMLDRLREAVDGGTQLRITYFTASRDETTERVVDPVAVHLHDGQWYVDAWCHRAQAPRTFRADRIESFEPTGVTIEPGSAVGPSSPPGRFDDDAARITLRIPAERSWVVDSFVVDDRREIADGRIEVTLPVAGPVFVEQVLLRLGAGAEIVDNPGAVEQRREVAARVLEIYEANGST